FLIMLMYLIEQDFTCTIFILLIALAMTATASIYQLFSLALTFCIVQLCLKEKPKPISVKVLRIFFIPVVISLYYIFIRHLSFGYGQQEKNIQGFFEWWSAKTLVPILSVIGLLS